MKCEPLWVLIHSTGQSETLYPRVGEIGMTVFVGKLLSEQTVLHFRGKNKLCPTCFISSNVFPKIIKYINQIIG